MHTMQPPAELIITELIYFFAVLFISLYIYFRTKEFYDLTKHKGIYHFRNIFLYFGLAHLFRFSHIFVMFSRDFLTVLPFIINQLSFVIVSYFSTMAILSVVMSVMGGYKFTRMENILMHLTAIMLSVIVGLTWSNFLLIIAQSLVFLGAILFMVFSNKRGITGNKLTFVLLFVFWIVNSLAFIRGLFPRELKIPLYIISIVVYLSVLFRVKRFMDGKKRSS